MRLIGIDGGGGEGEVDDDCEGEGDGDGGGDGDGENLSRRDEEPTVDRPLLKGRFIADFILEGIVSDRWSAQMSVRGNNTHTRWKKHNAICAIVKGDKETRIEKNKMKEREG